MKNENKLQAVVNFMNSIETNPQHCDVAAWAKESRKLIQEFLVDNMAKAKTTYDIKNYTGNDDMRPVFKGICYDPATKSAVATDTHLLVVDRVAYDQSIVDKYADKADRFGRVTVDKYGNLIEYAYPNYTGVFPKYDIPIDGTIDIDELQDYIKRCRAFLKANGYGTRPRILYRLGDSETPVYFDAKMLLSFAIATEGHYTMEGSQKSSRYLAFTWRSDDRDAIIMPLTNPTEAELIENDLGLIIKHC